MALDAAVMALCADELKHTLGDARIDKIHQPARDTVLLQMRSRTASFKLLLAARSGAARVCLTEESYENPLVPPSFCMLLRKHLNGGRLLDVRTPPGERILFLEFLCVDEMGDLVHNTLAAELMGRYCNLVLVRSGAAEEGTVNAEGGRVLDALKRVDFEDSEVRQLLPGLRYTMPPLPNRPLLVRVEKEEFRRRLAQSELAADEALRKEFGGVGPVVVREVLHRAFGAEMPLGPPKGESFEKLWRATAEIQADFAKGGQPWLVRKADGAPAEFSFTQLTQYAPAAQLQRYETFSQLLEAYYAEKDRAMRMQQRSGALRKRVQNLYKRAVRKQAARTEELAESQKSEPLRVMGEVLTANLHAVPKGAKSVRLPNWYEEGAEITIPLDVRHSPAANAQRYFKEYKKRQTATVMLAKLLQKGEREMAYLQTVLYEIDAAENQAALDEVRNELTQAGFLRGGRTRDKRHKPLGPWRYRSADGFEILAGRNNTQNEQITLKTARGKDLWFHVKTAPGSHVVVLSRGDDIPLATQNEAAMLAVWHSDLRASAKVPVDYTIVKNIRKTRDLPPGMVLYDHYETAYITVDTAVIEALQKRPV